MAGEQIDGAAFEICALSNALANGYFERMATIPAVSLLILVLNH